MLYHAHAETVAERSEAKIRREAKMLPKFSRHYQISTRTNILPRTDAAALAVLHNLRTGTRPLPHPPHPLDKKKPDLSISSPRQRAVTSLGFHEADAASVRKSKIIFSSDDETIFAAGSSLPSTLPSSLLVAPPIHEQFLQFVGTKVAVIDVCRSLSSGACTVLHTLKLDACPIGLTAVAKIIKASHCSTKLTRIVMNNVNGSKRCPLTLPSERATASEAIAHALITSPSIVFACLRNNGLGRNFACAIKELVTERNGNLVLSSLDITGNPAVGSMLIGDVACYFGELQIAYSNLSGAQGAQVLSTMVESAERHGIVHKSSKCHPLALLNCSMCGLSDASAEPLRRLLSCPKLKCLTKLDISRNRLECNAAFSIAEALPSSQIQTLMAGYQFFGLKGTIAIMDACVSAPYIKYVHLENTAPMDKQHVWERSIYLMLIDRPSIVNCIVEWPPKKPRRQMQTGILCRSARSANSFQQRALVCDGKGLYCIRAAGDAALNDITKSNIKSLCSNSRQREDLAKLLAARAMHIFSIFQRVCLEQEENPFSLRLKGWSIVVRRCFRSLEAGEDSTSSSDSEGDEDNMKLSALAERIFRACTLRVAGDSSTSPSLSRPQWLEALVRLAIMHFHDDTPTTAASQFLDDGLFKAYSSVSPPDFWRKKNLYDRKDICTLFTNRLSTQRVLLDIFVQYAHASGHEPGKVLQSPRGMTFSRWCNFLRQFKLFDKESFTKADAKFPFIYSLPLSIDADEHRSGFKARELAFSSFLEAVARVGEMVSANVIEIKKECLNLFLAQKKRSIDSDIKGREVDVSAAGPASVDASTKLMEHFEGTPSAREMNNFSKQMINFLEYVELKAQAIL